MLLLFVFTYSDEVIPYKESIKEPSHGIECETNRQTNWHEFYTLGSNNLPLQ